MNNIDILNRNECTGCSVCYQVCPHDAIQMIETNEGFHYPSIIEEKCTNCGICVKKCHALNNNFKTEYKQEIYKVIANDEIRMKSSSGGAFSIIANYVLENNGYVCGASFTEDWFAVEHIIIDDKKYLYKLRGSKYIESNLGSSFIEIKKLLNDNNLVLFSGCPCQVSALYSYLGKDYNNLITVDLLCNSIVPQKVWKKYLIETFSNEELKEIEYISFRDKSKFGWELGLFIKMKNGKEYLFRNIESIYVNLFSKHISVKMECQECKYRKFERVSDITIGDFWNLKNIYPEGISFVLINYNKLSNKIFENYHFKKIYKLNNFINGGINRTFIKNSNHHYFFSNINKKKLKDLFIYSTKQKFDIGLIGFWFANNYGAILTYYALYKILESLNYSVLIIDSLDHNATAFDYYSKGIGRDFAKKYYNNISDSLENIDLNNLNEKCDMFITASDQLWNKHLSEIKTSDYTKYLYFLDFVDASKKKIAISTSFGDNIITEYDSYEIKFIKYYLNQFDYISLREKTGLKTLKDTFNIDGNFFIDPVFLLDIKEYDKLICDTNNEDYILSYCMLYSDLFNHLNNINKINGKKLININMNESVEEWLFLFKNADFIITETFHGTCFAIIFNKPFVCIRHDYSSSDLNRIRDILKFFNLEDRLIYNIDKLQDYIDISIDYNHINTIIDKEKEKSLNLLFNILKNEKINNDFSYKDDIINMLIKNQKELENKYDLLYKQNLLFTDKYNDLLSISKNIISDNWIKLFGIYNNENYIYIYFLGIRFTLKITSESINKLAWWIPIKKWREYFRAKFKIRPDQTRPDQTRPNILYSDCIYIYHNTKTQKLQPTLQYKFAA